MKNVISQSLGLEFVNINVYAKVYQNIPNGLRVIDIFLELSGDKIFTNAPVTKSSQTVREQNQMFDYRAHSESEPSVSVDFLRVVQLLTTLLKKQKKNMLNKKISNDQELIQSDPTSCPQNQNGNN